MKITPNSFFTFSLRAYRLLLYAYPTSFRDHYGDQMIQLFSDGLRLAQTSGVRQVFAWYLWVLVDLLQSSLHEHITEERIKVMNSAKRIMPTGLAGIVGGVLWIAILSAAKIDAWLAGPPLSGIIDGHEVIVYQPSLLPNGWLDWLSALSMLIAGIVFWIALYGLKRKFGSSTEPTGNLGLRLAQIGVTAIIFFACFSLIPGSQHFWPNFPTIIGLLWLQLLFAGLLLFAYAMRQVQAAHRWVIAPALVGIVGYFGLVAGSYWGQFEWLFLLLWFLFGGAWVWLGVSLWRETELPSAMT